MIETILCKSCSKQYTYDRKRGKLKTYCPECYKAKWDERKREINQERRKRIKSAIIRGEVTVAKRKVIFIVYDGGCAICGGKVIAPNLPSNGNDIHHIIPVREGGKSIFSNLILLCHKHHMDADYGRLTREELQSIVDEKFRNKALENKSKILQLKLDDKTREELLFLTEKRSAKALKPYSERV